MADSLLNLILLGGALGFVAVIYFLFAGDSVSTRLHKRAQNINKRIVPVKRPTPEEALKLRRESNEVKSPLLKLLMKPLPDFEKLGHRLERAGSKLSAKQFTLRCLLAMLIVAILFKIFGKPLLMGAFIGFILCAWLPLKLINRKLAKRQKAFLVVFPDAIDLIVRGLRSGLPVSESVKLVATEVPAPVNETFTHVVNTMQLGVSLERALQEVAKRLSYTEFNFFVTSIILQRETGGNLSEILNNLSEVLRKRYLMKMKIRAMTSEARASAIIIGSLPFFVAGAVSVLSPDYIKPLFTDYRGNVSLAIAAGLMTTGIWTMKRMSTFEI